MDVRLDDRSQSSAGAKPLPVRRVEVIALALPLKKPMAMANDTIAHAHNILVRIEAADGTIGWGEAASAPVMTGEVGS